MLFVGYSKLMVRTGAYPKHEKLAWITFTTAGASVAMLTSAFASVTMVACSSLKSVPLR